MKNYWIKIKNWLVVNHSEVISTLNVGALPSDFEDLELVIGTCVPDEFKNFYSVHNGQTSLTHLRLFDGDILLTISDIINVWKHWKNVLPEIDEHCNEMFGSSAKSSPDKGIKDDWWNPRWIPITANGSGDSYCIDLDPTDEGQKGQIIRMWHDAPQRELVSTSFRLWISDYIKDLEADVYEASNDISWGGIVRKNTD
jgi:cell wall assembly regulator SMI1